MARAWNYKSIWGCYYLFSILELLAQVLISSQNVLNVSIIHFNNFEARYLPTDGDGKLCKTEELSNKNKSPCYGGYARLQQKVSPTVIN